MYIVNMIMRLTQVSSFHLLLQMLTVSVLLLPLLLIAPLVSSSPLAKVKPQQEVDDLYRCTLKHRWGGEKGTQETLQV